MPLMDGYMSTQMLRQSPNLEIRSIPICAMTASAVKGDREKCLEAGMSDYLSKPVKSPILEKMLVKWLFDSETRQSLSQWAAPPKDPEAIRRSVDAMVVSAGTPTRSMLPGSSTPGIYSNNNNDGSGKSPAPPSSGGGGSVEVRDGKAFPFPDAISMSRNHSSSTATGNHSNSTTTNNQMSAPPLVSGDSAETIRSVISTGLNLGSSTDGSHVTSIEQGQQNINRFDRRKNSVSEDNAALESRNYSNDGDADGDVSMKSPTNSIHSNSGAWRRASDERSPVIRPSMNVRSKSLTTTAENEASSPSPQRSNLLPPAGMIRRSSREQGGLGHDFEVSNGVFWRDVDEVEESSGRVERN